MKKLWKILGLLLIICGLSLILKPLVEHGYNYICQLQLRSEISDDENADTDSQNSELPIEPPFVLQIPAISVDAVVVEGVGDNELKKGPGWDPRGVLPGMKGNVIIAAHNNIYGSMFGDLHQLKTGDMVYILKNDQKLTYRVESLCTIHESDPTTIFDTTEERLLTLITCAAPSGSGRRTIVTAHQVM
jgi:sortase A